MQLLQKIASELQMALGLDVHDGRQVGTTFPVLLELLDHSVQEMEKSEMTCPWVIEGLA